MFTRVIGEVFLGGDFFKFADGPSCEERDGQRAVVEVTGTDGVDVQSAICNRDSKQLLIHTACGRGCACGRETGGIRHSGSFVLCKFCGEHFRDEDF